MQVNAMVKSAVITNEHPQLSLVTLRIVANDVEDRELSHIPVEGAKFISGQENDT